MVGFVFLDMDRVEIIWARQYYGDKQTNHEAESFAIWSTLWCLYKFV